MFLFSLMFAILGLSEVAAQCPADSTYNPDINRCYLFSSQPAKYIEAQEACTNWGGNLTSISNAFQNYFVSDQATKVFANVNGADYWIGANMLRTSNWTWIDGTSFYYTDWSAGQPGSGSGLCASTSMENAMWKSCSCFEAKPYVCSMGVIPPTTTPKPTPQRPGHCDPGYTYYSRTDKCYTMRTSMNARDAGMSCQSLGGHLASIHDDDENNFITDLTSHGGTTGSWSDGVWIGLQQTGKGQPWYWTDGTSYYYQAWMSGKPDDHHGKEHCVQLMPDNSQRGKWNDQECDQVLRGYVCKLPALH